MASNRIGVIGAGAAGTCVLDTLARSVPATTGIEVTVFDHTGHFGPGRAYRPGGAAALLNLPSDKMSLRPDEPGHFQGWLVGQQPEFVSRELYGRYLNQVFLAAARHLRARSVAARVIAIDRAAGTYRLRTADGEVFGFDAVFLCVGSAEPADVYGLAGSPGFISDPYPLTRLAAIPGNAPVGVLGAGLSAVDAVLQLENHDAPLWIVSRSGYLPGVRDTSTKPVLRHVDPAAIKDLATARGGLSLLDVHRLVAREFAAQRITLAALWREFQPGEDPADRLRRQVGQVAGGDPALPVFIAVAGVLLQAWRLFDDTAKALVLRHWHGALSTLCAPMPAVTAARLVSMVDRGTLRIAGGVTGVHARDNGFTLDLPGGEVDVAHVVNTVRPQPVPVAAQAAQLVDSLLTSGMASAHPFGGLRLDGDTGTVLDDAGLPVRGLYALGELATGELYVETTVLPAITRRVQQSVHHLLGHEETR